MGYLLYHLRRIIMLPVGLFTAPSENIKSIWSESDRNKSLLLGLPALVIALLAVGAISYSQLASQEVLEDRYKLRFETAKTELGQLSEELMRKRNVERVSGSAVAAGEQQRGLPEESVEKFRELRQAQKIYLDKLISISPENDEYRFELALMVGQQQDKTHALSILNELAPEDAPGYAKAHSIMANRYFAKPTRSAMERAGNLDVALKHVDHVLTRDEEDEASKLLKGRILLAKQEFAAAYDIFESLLENNPNFYRELVELNKRLKRTERNNLIIERALNRFQQLANTKAVQENNNQWLLVQVGMTRTQQELEQFEEIETRINRELEKYGKAEADAPRITRLKEMLADTYLVWAGTIATDAVTLDGVEEATQEKLLELYSKAYQCDSDNHSVMQAIARLALSPIETIATQARVIYDPEADRNAPSSVLNQLGNHALLNKRFADAIRYYERAREKEPRNAPILNNLAYSYLVVEDNNAERALQLINEALRILPRDVDKVEASKFLHTKGTALKQLNRQEEAISAFERAIKSRPDHVDSLRSVIECYRALDIQPPEQYITRFEALREKNPG